MSSDSNSQTVNDGESSVAMDFMPSQRTEAYDRQTSSILPIRTNTTNRVKVFDRPVEVKSSLLGSSPNTPEPIKRVVEGRFPMV